MKGTWYFLRHAQTNANVGMLYNPSGDELTQTGKEQVAAAASYIQSLPLDIVFCSPLARAQETAKLLGVQSRVVAELADRAFGDFAGKPFGSISAYCKSIGADKKTFAPPGGESPSDVLHRTEQFINCVPPGNHLFITHAIVIMNVCEVLTGVPFTRYEHVDNVALWVFTDGKLVHKNWQPWLEKTK